MNNSCSNALTESVYCERHESYYHPFQGGKDNCPWCECDKLTDELTNIRDTFQQAVDAKRNTGGMHVPYFGPFCSIAPSVIKNMEWYIKRWNEILGDE